MSDMKCLICNEGKIIANLDGTYECDNPECPIWNGTETATFETLIRTRKALDVAVNALEYIRRTNPISFHFEAIEKALEQINEITKKE